MFEARKPQTKLGQGFAFLELLYYSTIRAVRKSGGNNALIGLLSNTVQMSMMIIIFYAMFSILGVRGAALRGDFLLYIMSGIFMYMIHIKAVTAVTGSEGPTSPMMQHAPMNTMIAVLSKALADLYTQIFTAIVILFFYHVLVTPITIYQPVPAFGMFMLAWFSGAAVGMVFLALKPWAPGIVGVVQMIYQRANMIASGKMFVANTLPGFMHAMFDWNPLFHIIDQIRGFLFINYSPRTTSWEYSLYLSMTLFFIGLLIEFFTRKRASLSWGSRSFG